MLSISNVTDADQVVRYAMQILIMANFSEFDTDQCSQQIIYHPDTGELVTNLLYEYEGFWLALLRRRTETVVEPTVTTGSDDVEMKEPSDAGRSLQAILFDSTVSMFSPLSISSTCRISSICRQQTMGRMRPGTW
ncbi:hypothetical protein GQ600_14372 [Phytophthora cactorum]|nr:hypothetical protein GQ600_14372 [Phytophthora cactorum]